MASSSELFLFSSATSDRLTIWPASFFFFPSSDDIHPSWQTLPRASCVCRHKARSRIFEHSDFGDVYPAASSARGAESRLCGTVPSDSGGARCCTWLPRDDGDGDPWVIMGTIIRTGTRLSPIILQEVSSRLVALNRTRNPTRPGPCMIGGKWRNFPIVLRFLRTDFSGGFGIFS